MENILKYRFNKTENRWRLALRILPIVILIVVLKAVVNINDWEFLSLNSLFTALLSANIFLIGFLITGTLSDYKESEKLPGDIASSIETMADEALITYQTKKSKESQEYLLKLSRFNEDLIEWFYNKKTTENILEELRDFNTHFINLESQAQSSSISRLKQEQNNLRKLVNRIHTIRTTSFLATGYVIAEIITVATTIGLVFINMEKDLKESMFLIGFVSYILIYMIYFIKDLDNPFGYATTNLNDSAIVDEVSLTPLFISRDLLQKYSKEIGVSY